jgi:DNA mismatch repair protein MutS2
MNNYCDTLEFNKITDMLRQLALSERAQKKLANLRPSMSEAGCREKMQETTDAKLILESQGTPPLAAMNELDKILELCSKGAMLVPEQLLAVAQFLITCKRMKSYLKKAESLGVGIAYYGGVINDLGDLFEEIDRSIRNGQVDDSASPGLRDTRRKLESTGSQVRTKVDGLLRSKKEWFTDSFVSTRNGHFVLPVKKEFRNSVPGIIIDTSATGGTIFIEPAAVQKLQAEISLLQIEEENEIRKVLYTLTALVDEQRSVISLNMEAMESLDIVFAKAKLSVQMKAIPVKVSVNRSIIIKAGRHPLLNQTSCVPLDFEIGGNIQGVIITGPNTGGKTVALKTAGLLSIMAQSGLHAPVEQGSEFCMNNMVLCDIGDGQSITENLSTFSSHIINIINILSTATKESLVLLDELGSGTDPAEGMGIAVAILEELRNRNCLFVATTHYPEIKEYARRTEKLVNARMAFDKESLKPLYRLEIGEAGESCALYIAKRLGFPQHLLKIAHEQAYGLKSGSQQAKTNYFNDELLYAAAQNEEECASNNNGASNLAVMNAMPVPVLQGDKEPPRPNRSSRFTLGDCVIVYPQREIGIVYQTSNERGEIGVQIKDMKKLIPHKRLKLHVPAGELYPPDYDFSIIFDTVANRKARKKMGKGHNPDLIIKYDD